MLRILAATVAALTWAVLLPSTAHADDLVVVDPRDDYWHDTRSSGEDPYPGNPDWGDPDLLRTAYHHNDAKVRVRLKVRRLERSDAGYWEADVRLRTNEGMVRRATLFKPSDGQVVVGWEGGGTCFVDPHVDYAEDAFVLVFSRSCLSNPRTIAFKSATRWWPTSDDYPYLDVTGTDGYRMGGWSAPVRRG